MIHSLVQSCLRGLVLLLTLCLSLARGPHLGWGCWMRSHPACCPAQKYPAPGHRDKQQSERDAAPGTYLGCLYSSPHFSEKGQQRMCRKHSPWWLLECAGADTRPLAALSYQSPPPQPSPSKFLTTVLLSPLHAGGLHRTSVCPRLRSRPFAVTDIS